MSALLGSARNLILVIFSANDTLLDIPSNLGWVGLDLENLAMKG